MSLESMTDSAPCKPSPWSTSHTTSRETLLITDGRVLTGGSRFSQRRRLPVMSGVVAAILLAVGVLLSAAAPAQAASYRDLKSVRYGSCLYAYGDPLEDLYAKACSTTPAKYGNWSTTLAGYYNNHPLWIIKRQGGSCLGVLGTASSNYLYSSCVPANSRDVWEVFTTGSGRYVLKSFGAYRSWGQHTCLTFAAAGGSGSVRLAACNLASTTDQIFR